jgi:phosphate-selective porin
MTRSFLRLAVTLVLVVAVSATAATGSELDDRLNRHFRGAWGVLEVEVASGCGGTYSDNEVGDVAVASKAEHRFAAGELVTIDKVNAKRQRVDLLLTLGVPYRAPRIDGPFELFEDLSCQVQLIVPVSRELIKNGDMEAISRRLGELVRVYPTLEEATASDAWNGRELPPLPEDYADTLQRHAIWQADQTNAAVAEATARALDAAADVADDVSDDPDYLGGFAAGAEAMSSFSTTDCSLLLGASFTYQHRSAPKDKPGRWRDGWDDGQELIFNVLVADRLQACTVPVPEASRP